MIRKSLSPHPDHVRVIFELPSCIWADRIFLVGDFNQWSVCATPMQQARDGVWRATLDLPNGSRHEFRYLIDGQWKTDSHADGFVDNGLGSENSLVYATITDKALVAHTNSQVPESVEVGPPINPLQYQPSRRFSSISELARRVSMKQAVAA